MVIVYWEMCVILVCLPVARPLLSILQSVEHIGLLISDQQLQEGNTT